MLGTLYKTLIIGLKSNNFETFFVKQENLYNRLIRENYPLLKGITEDYYYMFKERVDITQGRMLVDKDKADLLDLLDRSREFLYRNLGKFKSTNATIVKEKLSANATF